MKAIFTAICLGLVISATGQTRELVLASDTWPPFTQEAPAEAVALDLVKEALKQQYITVDARIIDFGDVIDGIRDRQFDGSAALWLTKEREQFMLFSEPYLTNQLILVGRKGSNVNAGSAAELAGNKVAVVETYAYGTKLEQVDAVEFVPGKSDQENLTRLLKGEVDYMLVDALLMEYVLKYQSEEVEKYLSVGTKTMLTRTLHFAIHRDVRDAEKIISEFNNQIQAMVRDGSYNRILKLNWVRADVDGDGTTELVLDGNKAGYKAPEAAYSVMTGNTASTVHQDKFYVEGQLYDSWEKIPETYKVAPLDDYGAGVRLLSFGF